MPQSEVQTSAVPVAELRRALRAVLPHLSTDDTIPMLTEVEVTLAEGTLTLAATDRFTLAAARANLAEGAPAIQWSNTVCGKHLKTLALMLPRMKQAATKLVRLTVTDTHISLRIPDNAGYVHGAEPEWTLAATNSKFVAWRPLVDKALASDGARGDVYLNPGMFKRWAHLTDNISPVRVIVTSDKGPIILLANGAIGVQMPLRKAHLGHDTARALAAPWRALAAA